MTGLTVEHAETARQSVATIKQTVMGSRLRGPSVAGAGGLNAFNINRLAGLICNNFMTFEYGEALWLPLLATYGLAGGDAYRRNTSGQEA